VVTVMLMRYFLKHESTLVYSMREVSCEKV
jgi:hypothetical protein